MSVKIVSKRRGRSPVSWPALCRPSTTGGADRGKVVDGRDKSGHDTMGTAVPPACYFNANAGLSRPSTTSTGVQRRLSHVPGLMEGKVAVVTGAGGGIGREIAIMMAGTGAKVIVADIGASVTGEGGSASPAEQTKQLIEQAGGAAEICTESVSSWGSAQKIVQAALDHYGRIDAVVNNAGILRDVI